jgi:hypothetical protein
MEKPMSLQEFAEHHNESYDLLKKFIKLYMENWVYYHKSTCAVCDKELTDEEIKSVHPSSFNYTCAEHSEYRKYILLDAIREELGFPPNNHMFFNIK